MGYWHGRNYDKATLITNGFRHLFQSPEDAHEKEIEQDMKTQQFAENGAYKHRRMTTGELDITRKNRIFGKAGRRQTIAGELEKIERPWAKSEGTAKMTTSLQEMKISENDNEIEIVRDDLDTSNDKSFQVNNRKSHVIVT